MIVPAETVYGIAGGAIGGFVAGFNAALLVMRREIKAGLNQFKLDLLKDCHWCRTNPDPEKFVTVPAHQDLERRVSALEGGRGRLKGLST